VEFNRRMKNSREDVGIWHETYLVPSGAYEAIYSGMPLYGLARAGHRAHLTTETESARLRLGTGKQGDFSTGTHESSGATGP